MKFGFVTLYVQDMEKSLHFYNEALGLNITERRFTDKGGEMAMLGEPGQPNIELLFDPLYEQNSYTGFSIGIDVEDLDAAVAHMETHKYFLLRGPYSPTPGVRFSFVKDPNDITVQLTERTS